MNIFTVMLIMEQNHSSVELIYDLKGLPSTACAFVMDNVSAGIIIINPTRLLNSITPIYILTIHKKFLVQQPHLINRFTANQHESTDK